MKRLWSAVLGLALSAATPAFADTNLVFAFWGDPPEVPPLVLPLTARSSLPSLS